MGLLRRSVLGADAEVGCAEPLAGIEAGTIVLGQPGVAVFEADEGGGVRFVPAQRSYRPPDWE